MLEIESPEGSARLQAYFNGTKVLSGNSDWECFLHWKDDGNVLEISYSYGDELDSLPTMYVCREILKRFKMKRVGAGAWGWYEDSQWTASTVQKYGPYSNWIDWLKNYSYTYSYNYRKLVSTEHTSEALSFAKASEKVESEVVAIFNAMDARYKDAST